MVALRRPRILVVDDDPDLLASVRSLIESSLPGVDVDTVADAEEALRHAFADRPDVVLVDYRLPKKDGIRFLADLRVKGLSPRRLLMTGFPDQRLAEAAVNDLHVEGYFQKPFNPAALTASLKLQLELARPGAGRIPPTS